MEGKIKLHNNALMVGSFERINGEKCYNQFAGFSQNRNRVLAVLTFMLICFNLNAQFWEWNDCVEWFENTGWEGLAVYAHPTSDVQDFTIIQTSPDIIVEYEFKGFLSNYTAKYKIVGGDVFNNGRHHFYFKDVIVLKDEDPVPPFKAWDGMPKFTPDLYRKLDFYLLYGPREFDDIPNNRTKAAVALMIEFMGKWFN